MGVKCLDLVEFSSIDNQFHFTRSFYNNCIASQWSTTTTKYLSWPGIRNKYQCTQSQNKCLRWQRTKKQSQAVAKIQLGYGSMPPLQIGDRNTAKKGEKYGSNPGEIRAGCRHGLGLSGRLTDDPASCCRWVNTPIKADKVWQMICGEEDDRIARIADANTFYASCKHGFCRKGCKILRYWKSKHIMTRDAFPESSTFKVLKKTENQNTR